MRALFRKILTTTGAHAEGDQGGGESTQARATEEAFVGEKGLVEAHTSSGRHDAAVRSAGLQVSRLSFVGRRAGLAELLQGILSLISINSECE